MATIVCSAEKVKAAAQTTIDNITAIRKAEDERTIAKRMKQKRFILFGRTITREEAIKDLTEDRWSFYPYMYAWGDYEHAKKLLLIAEHGDPVTLNEEDARVLF